MSQHTDRLPVLDTEPTAVPSAQVGQGAAGPAVPAGPGVPGGLGVPGLVVTGRPSASAGARAWGSASGAWPGLWPGVWPAVSLSALLMVWELVALVLHSRYFPGPGSVATVFVREVASGDLPYHVGITLLRVAGSFVLAMAVGGALGLALGRRRDLDRFFDSWLIFFLNLPALVTIILCYVWFGLTESAAILAVALNKIPNVAVQLREGARSLSKELDEMAVLYRFGWKKTLLHVTLPQLAPFFAASARSGLALVWKIVLVVELLGRSNGVGQQLNVGFQLFDVPMILAYAIAFIMVVQLIEVAILQPLEERVNRWRR